MKKTLTKYLVTLLIGFIGVVTVLYVRGEFSMTLISNMFTIPPNEWDSMMFQHFTDAFFISGVLITSAGAIIFTSNHGAFDMLAYGVTSFMDLFRKREKKKYDSFYDYKESRADKKSGFGFLLICGAFFLIVSMIMLYCHYQAPAPTS